MMTMQLQWSEPQLVLDGSPSSGCVEKRSRVGPYCEFDGKLSVVKWSGRTFVYARANLNECGARHGTDTLPGAMCVAVMMLTRPDYTYYTYYRHSLHLLYLL